jgi:hypothetical protein
MYAHSLVMVKFLFWLAGLIHVGPAAAGIARRPIDPFYACVHWYHRHLAVIHTRKYLPTRKRTHVPRRLERLRAEHL